MAKKTFNEKYPDGIDGQKLRIEIDGFTITHKGKRFFVADYESRLCEIE